MLRSLLLLVPLAGGLLAAPLDSLLLVQRERAGAFAAALFAPLENPSAAGLDSLEAEDYRFLLANLPLSDLCEQSAADLLENVELARRARREFAWGESVPADLFRHFVLPARVSQEPFTRWRGRFLAEIGPRVRDLPMERAALEVNHWCHERATYRPTDGRDQDPLTTIRAGFGRCEEEMILAIAALRSVGIPARQCYTPYWAHSDDNHAWVEVWADGAWHYVGACEPAQRLDQAWFSDPAQRAMLVVSSVYGAPDSLVGAGGAAEELLQRRTRSASLNSTAVYGPVRRDSLRVVDRRGRPLAGRPVTFHLWNYGGWMPALVLRSDADGVVAFDCGRGDWLATAGKGRRAALLLDREDGERVLRLEPRSRLSETTHVEYVPPPAPEQPAVAEGLISAEGTARGLVSAAEAQQADSLFRRRLQLADSLRESRVWAQWSEDPALLEADLAPDSLRLAGALSLAAAAGAPSGELLELYRQARGNWGELHGFLFDEEPVRADVAGRPVWTPPAAPGEPERLARRLRLLRTASPKDLREASAATLRDHEAVLWPEHGGRSWAAAADSAARAREDDGLLPARVDGEAVRPWRGELAAFFAGHPELAASRGDKALARWIRKRVAIEEEPDRLGAPLGPVQALDLRRGTRADVDRLYLAFCRARGVPARQDPHSGRLERFAEGRWQAVELLKTRRDPARRTGELTIVAADSASAQALCLKDWCLQRWEDGRFEPLDLGWQRPLAELEFPLELPAGLYCLSAGRRRGDGSAAVRMGWLELEKGGRGTLELRLDP